MERLNGRDLNHYRAPSRFWERIEHNWLIRTGILVGLAALVGRCAS